MKKTILILIIISLLVLPAGADREDTEDKVRLPIVMYHHMSPKARLWGDYVISPEQFEADLIYLRENGYTPISSGTLLAWYDGVGELPEKPVMITFDDGYESTFVYAKPLLEKYEMPSIVSIIGSVAQQYSDTPDHMLDYSHMSWEMAAEADSAGLMEVQCHTWDMHHLECRRGCSPAGGETDGEYFSALSADLCLFRERYRQYIGRECTVLALPYGIYTQKTIEYARELGFRAVLTCTERVNLLSGQKSELMELGRYNRPSGVSSEEFFSCWDNG